MADLKQVEQAFLKADAAGDVEAARVLAGEVRRLRAATTSEPPAQPSAQTLAVRKAEEERAKGSNGSFGQNLAAGLVRGAGSIGATLLRPFESAEENEQRRQDMTNALGMLGADTNSLTFKAGKIGGEIAGTAGAGGAVGNVLARIPGAAAVAPGLVNAVRSGGMTTGQAVAPGALGLARDLGTRAVGGAVAGGASAGLVDPNVAGTGAVVGAALPVALKGAGAVGSALGKTFRGPEVPADVVAATQAARSAGYVVPPTQARPTLTNRLLEGFSGKVTTAQNASARNQTVTNRLAATEVGLPPDAPITKEALESVREQAGKAYQALAALPERPAVAGSSLMNQKAVEGFSPKQALQDLRQARNDATAWYAAYARSASPDDQTKAKAAAALATKLEKQFEEYAKSLGREDLVPAMQEARTLIAKTYTIEKALNPTTGSVDARKLGSMVTKGKPLSGGLREAGDFANRFPKAAQTTEGMGSLPQTGPLDWSLGAVLSAASMNPLAMGAVMARPAARSLALSPLVQNRLAATPRSLNLLANPQVEQLGYQAAPVLLATNLGR